METKEMKMKEIYGLKLGETAKVETNGKYSVFHITRIPGGWIFLNILSTYEPEEAPENGYIASSAVFVPYHHGDTLL